MAQKRSESSKQKKWVPALITLPRAFGALSAVLFQDSEKESGRSKYIRRQILYPLFCCMFRHNMLAPCCYHEPGGANCSFLDSESRDCGSNAPQGCRLQSHGCIYCQDWNCAQWTGQCLGGYFGTFSMAPHCGTRHQASGVPTSLPAKNEWTKKFRLLLPLWPNG